MIEILARAGRGLQTVAQDADEDTVRPAGETPAPVRRARRQRDGVPRGGLGEAGDQEHRAVAARAAERTDLGDPCERCGQVVSVDDTYCSRCGARIEANAPAAVQEPGTADSGWIGPIHAGLWKRCAALLLDSVLLYLLGLLIGVLLGLFMALSGATPAQVALAGGVLGFLSGAIYEIAFHASSFQATVGKAALRIKVTDEAGQRLSVARSTGRYIAKLLNFWTLGAGLVMAGFTRRRQALHDKVAGTLVVRAQAPPALVATAAPAPPAGPVRIALLLLLGLLPYALLGLTMLPVWQSMQRATPAPPATHAPQVSQQELQAGRRQVRAALFAVQPHRAQLSGRLASGEPFEQIGGTLEIDARNVESVDILKGAILIVFGDDALAGLAGEQLAIVPARRLDGTVTWLCGYADRPAGMTVPIEDYYEYTSVDEAYLPETCRQPR